MIINKLRDNGALTLSLVAEDETGIIGHIAFSPVTIGGVSSEWYGLGPVSVTPERQGEGIGFKPHANLTLPGVPAEYFLIQPLHIYESSVPVGEVAYHQAFNG